MKIGINRWTFPNDWSIEKCFQVAAEAGFDTIEINAADEGYLTMESTEKEVRGLVKLAQAAGIEISSLSSGLGWKYPLTSNDEDIRARGIANTAQALQIAKWLEVDTILLVPGVVSSEVPYDQAYYRTQEALKELAPIAEEYQVSIGVENVWNKFLLSPLEFARYLDEIDSPYVGAYFDIGNVLVIGYPDQWIRILGKRIRKIHVKDFKANIGNISAFCNPLQGDVPWEKTRIELEAIGYDGPITAEVDGYRIHPEIGARHIAESLRAVYK